MTKVVLAANVLIKGGVWRHVVDLAGGLQARGCQVAIALPKRASLLRNEAIGQGLSVHDLAPRSRVDIWHVHLADTYDLQMLAALPLARSLAGAVIITEHLPRSDASDPSANQRERSFGAWPAKTVFKRTEYAMCHRVVCVSEASRRFIMIRYGLDRRKVIAIPNGIEVAAVPTAWPQGSPVFVAIGAVIEQKGFDVLVDAAEYARTPWQVEVIGDGPHLATLEARAEERGLPVHFAGVSSDVGSILASATALTAPSRWEASPYVAMEAMEQGRPVVASRVDGFPEIVSDGVTGLLVNPDDPISLARALDRLAGDPALAESLGRAGRERVKSFSLTGMVDGLLRVYEEALSTRRWSTAAECGR